MTCSRDPIVRNAIHSPSAERSISTNGSDPCVDRHRFSGQALAIGVQRIPSSTRRHSTLIPRIMRAAVARHREASHTRATPVVTGCRGPTNLAGELIDRHAPQIGATSPGHSRRTTSDRPATRKGFQSVSGIVRYRRCLATLRRHRKDVSLAARRIPERHAPATSVKNAGLQARPSS